MNQFLHDVLAGLSATPKYLQSKYFYDAAGDELFQQIMQCPEYYLTRCELEIFEKQTDEIASCFTRKMPSFDVVELGAGDATKSYYLLRALLQQKISFNYIPVDISANVIAHLQEELPEKLPGLKVAGLNGEFFSMLESAKTSTNKMKVVLFLGSNIGNIPLAENQAFCQQLRSHLSFGDMVLIGFDLQKDPQIILDAYNDKAGVTSRFNLNLLTRINRELQGNFDSDAFKHFPTYDPSTGACKSYLVSLRNQQVMVAGQKIGFKKYEPVFMEVSQKYTLPQIEYLAAESGFKPVNYFYDSKQWFVDAVWQCV